MIHNEPLDFVPITPLQDDQNALVAQSDSADNQKVIRKRLNKSKKPAGYKEDVLQTALARHLDDLQWRVGGFSWFHIPNGGRRTIGVGKKLKDQGVKPGVADVCVILPAQKVIWIELKAAWGDLDPPQKKFCETVTNLDHKYYVVKGAHPIDVVQKTSAILRDNGVVV